MLRISLTLKNFISYLDYKVSRQKLLKFPYARISKGIINCEFENEQYDFLSSSIKKDSAAFSCLIKFGKNHLNQMYKSLFQTEYPQQIVGSDIFLKYFKIRIQKVIEIVNNSADNEVISYNLKILFYFYNYDQNSFSIKDINLSKIQQEGNLSHYAYYLGMCIKNGSYLSEIQKLVHKMNQVHIKQKYDAAFILFSIPQFQNYLPEKIINQCLSVVEKNLKSISNEELFQLISHIFNLQNEKVKQFVQKATERALQHKSEQNFNDIEGSKISLVRKLMKYRKKLGLENQKIASYLQDNPMNFSTIFIEKNSNKTLPLEILASKDNHKFLPQEFKGYYNDYLVKQYQHYAKCDEAQLEKFEELFKITIRFYKNISQYAKTIIETTITKNYYEIYSSDDTIMYWSTIILFRFRQKEDKDFYLILPYLQKTFKLLKQRYDRSDEAFIKLILLQRMIDLQYQLVRTQNEGKVQDMNFFQLNFKPLKTYQPINTVCYLIKKGKGDFKMKQKSFLQILPTIQKLLDKNEIVSAKILYTIMNAAYIFDREQKKQYFYLWKKIQNTFTSKLLPSKKFKIQEHDIRFLLRIFQQQKDKMKNFYNFLENVKRDYSNYDTYKDKLLEKSLKRKKYE